MIVGPALFALCQFFAKFSILLFYLRLAPIRWFRLSTYLLMALFTIYTIGIIALMVFPCTPVAKSWDYNITHGHCINRTGIFMATALVNIAGEVATLVVPMPVLMSLQMPTMQKVGLFCMFAVGMLCVPHPLLPCKIRTHSEQDMHHQHHPPHRPLPAARIPGPRSPVELQHRQRLDRCRSESRYRLWVSARRKEVLAPRRAAPDW